MRCPVCQAALRAVRGGDLEIDVCPRCGGSFFDRGELKETLNRLLTAGEVPEAPLERERRPVSVQRLQERSRCCPRCTTAMEKFNYCYDSNIILDRCSQCGGIWADRGEVLKCAQYRKGSPKLDRLVVSLAEHARHQEAVRRAAAWGSALMRPAYPGWAWWYLPALIPVRDDQPSQRVPVVTLGLLAVNVFIFAAMALRLSPDTWLDVFGTFGLVPSRILGGEQLWGLVTSMFLHVGLFHIFGNMLFLWIFGDNVEDAFGRLRFLGFYLICGLAAGLAHVLTNVGSELPCVGASGAVSGVLGAYFVFYPKASVHTLVFGTLTEIPAAAYIGIWIAFQVLYAVFYTAVGVQGGVAWFAHIGGFGAGLVLALAWRHRREALAARG